MTVADNTGFKAACIQITAGREMLPNLEQAAALIREAAAAGAQVVMTPENTSIIEPDKSLAVKKAFPEAAHPGMPLFADLARDLNIWLSIGSMAIRLDNRKLANRSFLFGPDGLLRARYDKIHMFDVDLPNGEVYRESATMQPGDQAVIAETPWGKLGLTICYDLRFAYLYRALAQAGAAFLTVPAAFTVPTGEAHWHVLLRARAIETGCFVFAAAQCGTHAEGRRTYGHSLIVAPWGEILADAGSEPGFILADIDTAKVAAARGAVPALRHDRPFAEPIIRTFATPS
ncbi:MAG: carbon-nitrogen hydrolase family protein [Rhodospirillaceae bacterium]|nr:MAG: carbon-nitrogen hydrolase family protein [Rhodospirillaceae bacterium]